MLHVCVRACVCMCFYVVFLLAQAVYTVLREAEDRSVAPIPIWEIPIWKDISPRQKKVSAALKLINDVLDDLIAICKVSPQLLEQHSVLYKLVLVYNGPIHMDVHCYIFAHTKVMLWCLPFNQCQYLLPKFYILSKGLH